MRIGLHDHEDKRYPNLALMKISSFHKSQGDHVEWFDRSKEYDQVYSSKVFTWTVTDVSLPDDVLIGGTGFDISITLPDHIESLCPDYSLYDCKKSYGFLTRGCIRKCEECFVPEKEGHIRAAADIEEFCRHERVVLMDNNVLASSHGVKQIEKIISLGLRVDFNQGLDARLIDGPMAKLLSKVRWSPEIRLACDSVSNIEPVKKAVKLLRLNNTSPPRYFCYVLAKDYKSTIERVEFLKGIYVDPFVQTLRNRDDSFIPSQRLMDLKRWVNNRRIFRSCSFDDYQRNLSKKDNQVKP
jgi:hypothetical protein